MDPLHIAYNIFETRDVDPDCTKATCPISSSYWGYVPSLPANSLFTALFSVSLLAFLVQGVFSRKRWLGFTIAMVLGSAFEISGYIGRLVCSNNPWSQMGFLIQICFLTIAPAFYAAGIYLCLSRIVVTIGPENSRLPAIWYPRIFISCDLVSLILQGMGGGIASVATHSGKSPTLGDNLMDAGLAFQVFTLCIFITLSTDFAFRTYKAHRQFGNDAFDQSHENIRRSKRFRAFVIALAFATLCILTRSVYRVAELSEGWTGHLIETQKYFIGLEGAIVSAGVLALNIFHPGFCFREAAANVSRDKKQIREKSADNSDSGELPVVNQVRET